MLLSYKPLHLEAQQRLQEEGYVVDIKASLLKESMRWVNKLLLIN